MSELSDEEKEDIATSIIKHFENPEPVSSPPKGGRKYGGKFRRRSSSAKDNRKSSSDKENDHEESAAPVDTANGHKTEEEKPQSEITISQESGVKTD